MTIIPYNRPCCNGLCPRLKNPLAICDLCRALDEADAYMDWMWLGPVWRQFWEKPWWYIWDLSGVREICALLFPNWQSATEPKASTFVFWFAGVWLALFGLASQLYESRLSQIQNSANTIYAQLGYANAKRVLSRVDDVQEITLPKKPYPFKPRSIMLSLFGQDEQNNDTIQALIDVVETFKDDLKGVDLRGATLTEAELNDADLRQARLSGANLSKAWLMRAKLQAASLRGTNLIEARITLSCMSGDLILANLRDANLSKAEFRPGALLRGANLSGANLSGAILMEADLSFLTVVASEIPDEGDFNGIGIHLKYSEKGPPRHLSDLSDYIWGGIPKSKLAQLALSGVDRVVTNLSKADLSGAQLQGTRLYGANLTGAVLTKTDLRGATLYGANLTGAVGWTAEQFLATWWDERTQWPEGFTAPCKNHTHPGDCPSAPPELQRYSTHEYRRRCPAQ